MSLSTSHHVLTGDARNLHEVDDESINLVVTSPPYPMIEMWDDGFSELNPEIGTALDSGHGDAAFDLMHDELQKVWEEVDRVLEPNGIACINIGDATRKIGGKFQLFPNNARIVEQFNDLGFSVLPDILWRKPTNKASKFMGSGMIPPNAYVTLEHEYILIFRKGGTRQVTERETRYESAYFWEERNKWFSDMWEDVQGTVQSTPNTDAREVSAAYPLDIPFRLINMYTIQGDTVLDPFLGTGTTTLAAMIAGRNSVGVDIDDSILEELEHRVETVPQLAERINQTRLTRHEEFIADYDGELSYISDEYGFPVMTKQEKDLQLKTITDVEPTDRGYRVAHSPIDHSSD